MTSPTGHRPAFFNLLQIQLPVGALTSITHRVTGVLLAAAVPFGVFLLGLSLRGPDGYAQAIAIFDGWMLRATTVVLIWALSHHLLAGLRHLLMDVDVGSSLSMARRSAWTVNVAGAAIALLAAAVLL
ncbi:MAG: succinate dehydrogenase, cytochrome b556 subunit [Betaproteobacteria bacterium]